MPRENHKKKRYSKKLKRWENKRYVFGVNVEGIRQEVKSFDRNKND